jgi:uncharacterized protein YvpB
MLKRILLYIQIVLLFISLTTLCIAQTKNIPQLDKIPLYKQPDSHTCGPTCASMLLKYYGKNVDIATLKNENHARTSYFNVKIPGTAVKLFDFKNDDWGYTHPDHLYNAIKKYIPATKIENASIQDIINAINNGKPVIVLVRSSMKAFHYIIIVGYEKTPRQTRLNIIDTNGKRPYYIMLSNFSLSWSLLPINYATGDRYELKCSSCKGDGHVWTKCVACSGTGEWSTSIFGKKMWTKCVTCSGTGKWSSKCPACLGQGHFPDFIMDAVNLAGINKHTMIVPDAPLPLVNSVSSQNFRLPGTWQSGNNTLRISSRGVFSLQVSNRGQKNYYYTYNSQTGRLTAKDAGGKQTNINIQWINQDSLKWTSPNGTKIYSRVRRN